jgi:hypothetical protein
MSVVQVLELSQQSTSRCKLQEGSVLLAESIDVFVLNGRLVVRDSTNIAQGPERAWFGISGREAHYPGLHMTDTLRKMTEQIASNFRSAQLRFSRVQFTFDPDGGHNEESWSKRFPGPTKPPDL